MTVLWVLAALAASYSAIGLVLGLGVLAWARIPREDRWRALAAVLIAWPALVVFALWVSGKALPAGRSR